jgi:hypothetical protein
MNCENEDKDFSFPRLIYPQYKIMRIFPITFPCFEKTIDCYILGNNIFQHQIQFESVLTKHFNDNYFLSFSKCPQLTMNLITNYQF